MKKKDKKKAPQDKKKAPQDKKKAPQVPQVVLEARKHAEHITAELLESFEATPWFYAESTFEVLDSGVLKIVYYATKSDTDHWYRRHLMWREELSHKWRVDRMGRYPSLAKAVAAIDERLGPKEEEIAA